MSPGEVAMEPEARARQEIDRQLGECGWVVQNHREINIYASAGVAVREFPLKTGFADYLLYVDGKAIGVIEAKPEGHTLTGVELQSARYTEGLPEGLPNHGIPLPFAYESTGAITQFTDNLDPEPRSREVFSFHRPEELRRLVGLEFQLREGLRRLPELRTERLWKAQIEAIHNLERSLAENRPRSLIQMATGSGKTYTACSFCYRLIKFAKAKRILFLVDRNNLGRQALNEFQQYISPYNGYKFTEEFNAQLLRKNTIDPASKVCITTIQRLYSILKGDEEYDEANEEKSLFESGQALFDEPQPVVYNAQIPIETFDVVIIDECHRSIYNVWRQVLEYFDAFLIGLTATPTNQTLGFFNRNLVQDYSHEKAVADGVNVGYDVYRIETRITKEGATLVREPGQFVPLRDRRTRQRRFAELDDDFVYAPNQLDRDVVSEDQIRRVIRTFRDRLPTEIFPGRREVPKTLIFAKNDLHADDIVKVIREEFARGNEFCQKLTSKTTGMTPDELLNQFRNSFNPRIVVTVDLVATGTDIKPLECLMFMRNINSASYFEQMKGRGVRVIDANDLQSVTPDIRHKTHFVIVDAVGVCENDKTPSKPLDRKPSVSLDKVLQLVAQGMVDADLVSTLAARLSRLDRSLEDHHKGEIAGKADGKTLGELASDLLSGLDPDLNTERAREKFGIPAGQESTAEQIAEAERERMGEALRPFHNPALRDTILNAKAASEQVIDETTQDELLRAGFDQQARERARSKLEDFHQFIEDNKDEIELLQILYNTPYRAKLRFRQIRDLVAALEGPPLSLPNPQKTLWTLYKAVEPESVQGEGGRYPCGYRASGTPYNAP